MDSFFRRNRNGVVLVALVFAQVIALATQVKRADPRKPNHDESRLLRIWAVTAISGPERLLVRTGEGARNTWHSYIDLRNVNQHNADLQQQLNELRMEQARLQQSARQARRLEALLSFKEQYVEQSLAAQVIGSSGTDSSHILYIDKGMRDGLRPEMPVITPDGIVGKLKEVYPTSSQVLLLNDQQSGVGVILEKTRRQGIMKGSISGQLEIHYVMSDEKIEPGEKVYTSGGDRIFPRGLEVGQVTGMAPDKERDGFQLIRVRPNANLFRLEEVLVVTKIVSKSPALQEQATPAEMLATRLPAIETRAEQEEPKLTADGKPITPPPVRPMKALEPDRFSPPEERGTLHVKKDAAATVVPAPPKLERAATAATRTGEPPMGETSTARNVAAAKKSASATAMAIKPATQPAAKPEAELKPIPSPNIHIITDQTPPQEP